MKWNQLITFSLQKSTEATRERGLAIIHNRNTTLSGNEFNIIDCQTWTKYYKL